ncbi:MAG: UbiX family flavin prenyltransferase [Nevskia sp.]|nr:UbiX family flavin prenyltransferase [Nevskia sp.]
MTAAGRQLPYVLGITGASGAVYGVRLLQFLLQRGHRVELIFSNAALLVAHHELGWKMAKGGVSRSLLEKYLALPIPERQLQVHGEKDFLATVASGSHRTAGMMIVPCSMGTAAAIAHGLSQNLIGRAADVCLKQCRPLVVAPRETPFSLIHLRNLTALAEAGAVVVPAMPGFYTLPRTLDDAVNFVVGKVLDAIGIDHDLFPRWREEETPAGEA